MPQDIEFGIPFSSQISPHLAASAEHNLEWVRRFGLVPNSVDENRYLSWDLVGLMARWAPSASRAGLDLITDGVVLSTILDDQFDGPLAEEPEKVDKACAAFVAVLRSGRPPQGSGPLVHALADYWTRLRGLRSPWWTARAAEHFQWFIDANVAESRNRADRCIPSVPEYVALRRRSSFTHAMLDMSQAACDFEVPQHVWEIPEIQQMLAHGADLVGIINDVQSVEKEESRGDPHNLVFVLEHERPRTRAESLAEVVRLIQDWWRQFGRLEDGLAETCARHHLGEHDASTAYRLADAIRSAVRAMVDWGAGAKRYSDLVPSVEPAYTANLL